MAFEVEDGTGSATATSLASVADADEYWTDREGTDSEWLALDEDVKQRRLVLGSDYLRSTRRYSFTGTKKSVTQRQPFPRTGMYERGAGALPDDIIPRQAIEAVCYLAWGASSPTALQPDLERGGAIASESVGPLSVSYRPDAPTETVIVVVDGILEAITKSRKLGILPSYSEPSSVDSLYGDLTRG